jgi:hypothetical protein
MPAEKRSAEQDPQEADPPHKRVDRGEDSESQTQREPAAEVADKPTAEAADKPTAEAEQTPPEDPQQEAQEQQDKQARTLRIMRTQF